MLTLPVPEMVHGTYAVAAGAPPGDPMELAREQVTRRVPAPLRELALGMLGSPLLTLDLRPAGKFPPLPTDLLAAFGASSGQVAEVSAATHVCAVRAAYQPGWPPAHEWAARAVAGALGAALDAPVVDVFTPQVLDPDRLWRSLPDERGHTRLVDWMLLAHTEGPAGFWFNTKGLARFGLPELHAEDVPADLVEPCGQLLNGLARRLLDLWVEELRAGQRSAFAELPETVPIGPADVAAAHGAPDPRETRRDVRVRLRLDTTESQALLTVLPPGPDAADGVAGLCTRLFG
ncbi:hypothetical protein [Thermomonospora echinospora]|uniref:hypothetical protein n=1 Tax=Thermomonospora echinospora TaxID=1992 RepID=UPI002285EF67|nr:hypothetical protein [Thermomonospora echinospora]